MNRVKGFFRRHVGSRSKDLYKLLKDEDAKKLVRYLLDDENCDGNDIKTRLGKLDTGALNSNECGVIIYYIIRWLYKRFTHEEDENKRKDLEKAMRLLYLRKDVEGQDSDFWKVCSKSLTNVDTYANTLETLSSKFVCFDSNKVALPLLQALRVGMSKWESGGRVQKSMYRVEHSVTLMNLDSSVVNPVPDEIKEINDFRAMKVKNNHFQSSWGYGAKHFWNIVFKGLDDSTKLYYKVQDCDRINYRQRRFKNLNKRLDKESEVRRDIADVSNISCQPKPKFTQFGDMRIFKDKCTNEYALAGAGPICVNTVKKPFLDSIMLPYYFPKRYYNLVVMMASQANGLESTTSGHSPSIKQYGDITQGPTVAGLSPVSYMRRERDNTEMTEEDLMTKDAMFAVMKKLAEWGVCTYRKGKHFAAD